MKKIETTRGNSAPLNAVARDFGKKYGKDIEMMIWAFVGEVQYNWKRNYYDPNGWIIEDFQQKVAGLEALLEKGFMIQSMTDFNKTGVSADEIAIAGPNADQRETMHVMPTSTLRFFAAFAAKI